MILWTSMGTMIRFVGVLVVEESGRRNLASRLRYTHHDF